MTTRTAPAWIAPQRGRGVVPVPELIKEFILLNRLSPGDPMPTEADLAEQLGVGRSSIREAIKVLIALDIVQVRHGHGTFVGELSLGAMVQSLAFRGLLNARGDQHILTELVDIRQWLESALGERLLSGIDERHVLRLRRLAVTMQEKAAADIEFLPEDREFHECLMESTDNNLLVQLTGAFWDVLAISQGSLGRMSGLRESADAHVAIVEALEASDAEGYRAAIEAHYAPIRSRMARESGARQE